MGNAGLSVLCSIFVPSPTFCCPCLLLKRFYMGGSGRAHACLLSLAPEIFVDTHITLLTTRKKCYFWGSTVLLLLLKGGEVIRNMCLKITAVWCQVHLCTSSHCHILLCLLMSYQSAPSKLTPQNLRQQQKVYFVL